MTPLMWLVFGGFLFMYGVVGSAVTKLSEIAQTLSALKEDARILRRHELPEIVRHLEAINNSVIDSH